MSLEFRPSMPAASAPPALRPAEPVEPPQGEQPDLAERAPAAPFEADAASVLVDDALADYGELPWDEGAVAALTDAEAWVSGAKARTNGPAAGQSESGRGPRGPRK